MECIQQYNNCEQIDYKSFEPKFSEYFPQLLLKAPHLLENVEYTPDSIPNVRAKKTYKFFRPVFPEIARTVPLWDWLRKQNEGRVCAHIMRMLYCTLKDPEFIKQGEREKNIILWTVMLHDCVKRGRGLMEDNQKDIAHPYYSGVEVVRFMAKMYKVNEKCKHCYEKVKELMQFIRNSVINDKYNNLDRMPIILKMTEKIFGKDTFAYLIIKMTIMHQSMPAPPDVGLDYKRFLSKEQIKSMCDKQYLELLKVVVTNDLINYKMHDPAKVVKYYGPFVKHFDNLLN